MHLPNRSVTKIALSFFVTLLMLTFAWAASGQDPTQEKPATDKQQEKPAANKQPETPATDKQQDKPAANKQSETPATEQAPKLSVQTPTPPPKKMGTELDAPQLITNTDLITLTVT